jgi:hypothetical protein
MCGENQTGSFIILERVKCELEDTGIDEKGS